MAYRLNSEPRRRIITQVTGDVNGNGRPEKVILTGIKDEGVGFWRDIMLSLQEIGSGKIQTVKPPFSTGYNPRLFLGNFTGRPGDDVLLSSDTGGSGGIVNEALYSYYRGSLRLIFSSENYEEEYKYLVKYLDNYVVEAVSESNNESYYIDISRRDRDYLDQIYNPDGKLIKPVEGFVSPMSGLYPIDFDGNGVYDLMVWQQISGLYAADALGYFQNVLTYLDGEFKLAAQYVALYGYEDSSRS